MSDSKPHNDPNDCRERYRGYWIIVNPLNGYIHIEKNGFKIAACATVADARVQIDLLIGE